MELFSHRNNLKPVKNFIQIDSIDDDLRNRLWDSLKLFYWDKVHHSQISKISYGGNNSEKGVALLIKILWHSYYKQPLDTMDDYWDFIYKEIREYFFSSEWFEIYDFIEFIANNYPHNNINSKFMIFCNNILKQELSAYRFVGSKITQITSEIEISEIEEALDASDSLGPVKIHLKTALDLLADRKSPDYRNSIKESISAVESICKSITNDDKATLGDCLKSIKKDNKIKLHPALNSAFSKLYGYTSGADGIRHALLEESDLDFEDAKFMIVSCSGFINYLISKVSKAEFNYN
jgi:hypothetical protein